MFISVTLGKGMTKTGFFLVLKVSVSSETQDKLIWINRLLSVVQARWKFYSLVQAWVIFVLQYTCYDMQ